MQVVPALQLRATLAVKLAVAFTVVCVSLLFLVASVATVMTTRGIKAEAFKRLDNDVAVTMRTFSYFEDDALKSAKIFATDPRVVHFAESGGNLHPAAIADITGILGKSQIFKIWSAQGRLLAQHGLGPDGSLAVPDPPSAGMQLALVGETAEGVEPIGDGGLAIRGIAPIRDGNRIVGAAMVGSRLDQDFADQLKAITGLEVGIAVGDSRQASWLAQTCKAADGKRLTGAVPRAIVSQVRDSRDVVKRTLTIDRQEHLAAFAPLTGDFDEFVGLLFIGEPAAPLEALTLKAQIFILVLSLVAAMLAAVVATLLSRTITDPIRLLADHASRIARGHLDQRLEVKSGDELELLSEAFNAMTESLAIMKFNDQNANPLTKLPGNLCIEAEVSRRLELNEPLALLYIDLDHFKAFNDKFGFEAGDRVIEFTAEVIRDAVGVVDHPGDFIGHVGGDDFVIITSPLVADRLCREIIRRFDADITQFYPLTDRDRGYFVSVDRQGTRRQFPLCSVSIGVVSNEQRHIPDYLALSSLAAEVKKVAKAQEGSSYVRDRRAEKAPNSQISL
ncbi:MAG: HAMP domain-containing protein [Cyanobacteria bacterium REEB65]|nr:HAMP domain-containing protein [Cyanobacteria bacterium REEB65]